MSVKIVRNDFEGMCAIPRNNELDCKVFKIDEVKISIQNGTMFLYIRESRAGWLYADSCFIGDITECTDYLDLQQNLNAWNAP